MKTKCALCALLAALSMPAVGAPMLETLNYARFYSASDPNSWYACENATRACQGSVAVPGTNFTAHYRAYGSADYGILKNYAAVSLGGDASGGAFPSFFSVGSRSGFIDSYTFSGGQGSGTAYFTFAVDGITSENGGAYANSLFQYVPANNGVLDWSGQRSFSVVDGLGTVAVPFVFGSPVEMLLSFYALAQVFQWEEGSEATADFAHTAVLSKIAVRDSTGQLIEDFAISSASGTYYGANGVVPEPGTVALLLAGLGCAALLRRQRKQYDN
jgi:hypothetical protein